MSVFVIVEIKIIVLNENKKQLIKWLDYHLTYQKTLSGKLNTALSLY